jgi:F0F1-type ATP synthase membrane subunit b/b'
MAEYEAAMRAARGEVYQELGNLRSQLQAERNAALEVARKQAETQIAAAKGELAGEVAALKQDLAAQSDLLATQITESILRRSAA